MKCEQLCSPLHGGFHILLTKAAVNTLPPRQIFDHSNGIQYGRQNYCICTLRMSRNASKGSNMTLRSFRPFTQAIVSRAT